MTELPSRTLGARARGALFGLGAAALFGLSAPLAKILLGAVSPVLLAGLLYLGAAAGRWLHRAIRPATSEARLSRRDAPRSFTITRTFRMHTTGTGIESGVARVLYSALRGKQVPA